MTRPFGWAIHIVSGLALGAICGNATAQTDSDHRARSWWSDALSLERIVNFPFSTRRDMEMIGGTSRLLRWKLERESATARASDLAGIERFQELLAEVAAFTSTETVPGERYFITVFAKSEDRALQRLSAEAGLPAPAGGAIVRLYSSQAAIPEPIRGHFGEQVGGITRWCRFVAVLAEDKSARELTDTISHELVHAYLSSCLGLKSDTLPRWFHEGVALYLSDAKDVYVSQNSLYTQREARSTEEYAEYHLILRYLEAVAGRQGVMRFIREAVEQRSIAAPLRAAVGTDSYEVLRARARRWHAQQQGMRSLQIIMAVLLAVGLWRWEVRWKRAVLEAEVEQDIGRQEAELGAAMQRVLLDLNEWSAAESSDESGQDWNRREAVLNRDLEQTALRLVEEGRTLAKLGKSREREATQILDEALRLAPRSPRVRNAVQVAFSEMRGIVL